jgi:flagellar basal-body rod protein FlgC
MDLTDSVAISVSALDAQRRRLDLIASNLANAQSTRSAGQGPYRRRDIVFRATPVIPKFQHALRQAGFGAANRPVLGVQVASVVEDRKPGKTIYDPRHPDADAQGLVHLPNINVMEEMVNMISASRAYEANVQAIGAARTMWTRALDIGR